MGGCLFFYIKYLLYITISIHTRTFIRIYNINEQTPRCTNFKIVLFIVSWRNRIMYVNIMIRGLSIFLLYLCIYCIHELCCNYINIQIHRTVAL